MLAWLLYPILKVFVLFKSEIQVFFNLNLKALQILARETPSSLHSLLEYAAGLRVMASSTLSTVPRDEEGLPESDSLATLPVRWKLLT